MGLEILRLISISEIPSLDKHLNKDLAHLIFIQ